MGNDENPHDLWVEGGRCPSISDIKSWCGGRPGHEGHHFSPVIDYDGSVKTVYYWKDEFPWSGFYA